MPTVIAVTHGDRTVGAWIVGPDTVTYRPVVDLTQLAGTALAAVTVMVALVAASAAARRRPQIGAITMGPGGWVSVKRAGCPPLRSTERRPWWARMLGAHRIVTM